MESVIATEGGPWPGIRIFQVLIQDSPHHADENQVSQIMAEIHIQLLS